MNQLEKFLYNRVKHNAKLKIFIRNIYQSIFDPFPKKRLKSSLTITKREGFFFGFHDKTPFSGNNKLLLANRFEIGLRMPTVNDNLTVGYFYGDNFEKFNPICETNAWNWHQGCMSQWKGEENKFLYNDSVGTKLLTKIYDIDNNETQTIDEPIGAVSPDGKFAIGYNFHRVNKYMTGYGYIQGTDNELDNYTAKESGIYLMDLNNGDIKFLFSIDDIAGINREPSMDNSYHYFSHCLFSPSSKRFVFMHRWNKGVEKQMDRYSRLISCDSNGKDLYIFPTNGMVSHIGWKDENHIVAYSSVKELGDNYYLFKDKDETFIKIIGEHEFNSDGHPSFSPDKKWMVTDTYPDRMRYQYLILYNLVDDKRYNIARLYHPKRYTSKSPQKHWACDLHPRWDREGDYIAFDSVFSGKRSLCTIDLNDWNALNLNK